MGCVKISNRSFNTWVQTTLRQLSGLAEDYQTQSKWKCDLPCWIWMYTKKMEQSHKNKQIIALIPYQNNYSCRYHQVVGNQTKQPVGSFSIQVTLVSEFSHSPLYKIFCMSINEKLRNLCVLTQLWWPLKGGMAKCYFYFKYLILAALFSGNISLFLFKSGSIPYFCQFWDTATLFSPVKVHRKVRKFATTK